MILPLRDYQHEVIGGIKAALSTGARRICVVMPTGAGKTKTAAAIVSAAVAKGRTVLWACLRAELGEAAKGDIEAKGIPVGVISDSVRGDLNPTAPVQLGTVQTMVRRNLFPPADLIIFDEFHHAPAPRERAFLAAYPDAYLIGLTATPERGDGVGLGAVADRLVIGPTVQQLTDLGHLVPAEIIAPAKQLRSGQIAERPVDAWLTHAKGRRALVFSGTVKIAEEHAAQFTDAGIPVAVVSDRCTIDERRDVFQRLRAGSLLVVCNVAIATEGTDLPEVEVAILARNFSTTGLFLQVAGRVLRPAGGKTSALIIDLHGSSHEHGHPADPRIYSLDGRGIRKPGEGEPESYCRVCGAILEPGEDCQDCGIGTGVPQAPQVVHAALEKFAGKRAESDSQRIATLRRWLNEAHAKGFKPGWAMHKFAKVYGRWPTRQQLAASQPQVAA